MRHIGIDYGTKRVGIAVSDEAGEFAMPLIVLSNSKTLVEEIIDIAVENASTKIVLGESKNYKGEANAILESALALQKTLEEKGFTVYMEPEFMTSTHAERFQGKHAMLDASAAALILQSYLDSHRNKKE